MAMGESATENFSFSFFSKDIANLLKIFLACSSADLLALLDQTTLATSLYIIGNALGSTSQVSWIASGYFM